MPVFQELVNFDQLIHQLKEAPIFINDIANESEEDKESIKSLITTRYSSDMISLLPSCNCGHTKGEFSIGVVCPECNTIVKSSIENDIEPIVWFRKPNGVSKLISPMILMMLKQRFKKSGFNVIQWLIDTTYRTNVKQPKVIDKIMATGIQRGYNNFVDNFDIIMSILFSIKEFPKPKNQTDYLEKLLKEKRDCVFCDYIPLPNKSLLVIEKTNVGIYVDTIIVEAVDAIKMLVSIDNSFYDQSQRVKENRTAKALCKLTDFYEKFNKSIIAGKTGLLRKHCLGSRTNFSFRAVISSITDKHNYDELYVPWGIGVTAFRYHLVNKLLKLGMDLNSSIGLLLSHVETYHPLLDKLLQELIDESPTKGIYCIGQRN